MTRQSVSRHVVNCSGRSGQDRTRQSVVVNLQWPGSGQDGTLQSVVVNL